MAGNRQLADVMKSVKMSDLLVKSSQTGPGGELSGSGEPRPGRGNQSSKGVSLFEDTFSDPKAVQRRRPGIWLVAGILIAGGISGVWWMSPGAESPGVPAPSERVEAKAESPLARVVEEVRRRGPEESQREEVSSGQPGSVSVPPLEQRSAPGVREVPASPSIERKPEPKVVAPVPPSTEAEVPSPAALGEERVALPEVPPETQVAEVRPDSATVQPVQETISVEPDPDQIAYQALLRSSQQARRLVEGGYPTLEFRRWRVVQRTPSEVWLDLTCAWANGGDEVHFIWSVNDADGNVRALSEAARSLDTGLGS